MKVKITIAYDGSSYAGWQIQPNGPTIQEKIEKALKKMVGKQIKVIGAGRTDAGVHAKAQVAHFSCETLPNHLLKGLNALTPDDIAITDLTKVDDDFHARFSAKEKCYTYAVATGEVHSPFDLPFSLHYTYPVNYDAIDEGISYLLGKHDFSAFANDAKVFEGKKDPVKTVRGITLQKTAIGFDLIYKADGFLYKMVRNLTGLLLDIGRGKKSPSSAHTILKSKDRKLSSPAAPANGLTLTSITY